MNDEFHIYDRMSPDAPWPPEAFVTERPLDLAAAYRTYCLVVPPGESDGREVASVDFLTWMQRRGSVTVYRRIAFTQTCRRADLEDGITLAVADDSALELDGQTYRVSGSFSAEQSEPLPGVPVLRLGLVRR